MTIFNTITKEFKNYRGETLLAGNTNDIIYVESLDTLFLGKRQLIRYDLETYKIEEYPLIVSGPYNRSNYPVYSISFDPKHKIRIVDAWKKRGESVAMIGDGVNDAPALKAADIGVALGSGSDVAHEISDMVLLDNNLSTVSAAVKEGRTIFDNIRKVIVYLMADSFSEIVLIVGSLLMGLPLPLLASQIFWINLVTDGFPDIALTPVMYFE